MTTDQLLHIIEQGESETIEFKTSYSKEVIESIISFVKKHLMVEYIITSEPQRQERFDYLIITIHNQGINLLPRLLKK